jgi:hypothetical protein
MQHSAKSIFLLDNANLGFYFTALRQVRSPMADFLWLLWRQKELFLTPRYAKKLRALRHSAELQQYFNLLIRDQVELIHEKNRGSKISWDCPFKQIFRAAEKAPPFPPPPTTPLDGSGSTGSFHPTAAALVMVLKQWGSGLTQQGLP